MNLKQRVFQKEDPKQYQEKDIHLTRTLRTRDLLALGVGTIVSTAIFTLPGVVAAQYTGPAVSLSFLLSAVVAALIAFVYAEMAAVMPFAGSAYTWIRILFGEGLGWLVGWALIAEYTIAIAFVASGFSANLRGLMASFNLSLPASLSQPMGSEGGVIDLIAAVSMILTAILLSRGASETARVQNVLVVLKVMAILLFVVVGATAIHLDNYIPFLPDYNPDSEGTLGGWQGIYAGSAVIFISYIGFDSLAANSAEAINPGKTMPRGILGSLVIAVSLFIIVSLVLVGMFHYTAYEGNAEPVGWALRNSGHPVVGVIVQAISVFGMFTALVGMMLAGSRLIYSFGRDGIFPKWVGQLNRKFLPNRALLIVTIVAVIVGSMFPFDFLAELMSAGTLVAFMFVTLGLFSLRRREGKDLPVPSFKFPLYPVLPIITFICIFAIFWGLSGEAKFYTGVWFILGIIYYAFYLIRTRHRTV
ncbi:APC family permease [Staphylococcus auricularis]|uniref:Amino acid permease n=1 Tax=Staphylococcus auricularis TaxID=29379 RepID=A0ABX5ID98_9STAP|nr:amino acid permease [Staphylococcus auricularis]MCE5039329.1 amino acid permease [Staphylococcus auricularis]MEB6570407.1 amino acid permease [Staphylococcus auricularis]PTH16832.1 amino acid permease [Staphylococcus auricularis]